MTSPISLGKKQLDGLPQQFDLAVTKEFCQPAVYGSNAAMRIDNHDTIRVGLNQLSPLPGQRLRGGK